MSKRGKAKVAELLALQHTYAQEITSQLAEAEGINDDPSKKEVKLREVQDSIKKADDEIASKLLGIADRRAIKKALKILGVTLALAAAAITIPAVLGLGGWVLGASLVAYAVVIIEGILVMDGDMARTQKNKLLKQNPGLAGLTDQVSRALDQIVRRSPPEALGGSAFFSNATDCPPLHECFKEETFGDKSRQDAQPAASATPPAQRL